MFNLVLTYVTAQCLYNDDDLTGNSVFGNFTKTVSILSIATIHTQYDADDRNFKNVKISIQRNSNSIFYEYSHVPINFVLY